MAKKHQDLQPWLDYFQMLHTYEEKGFLQVVAEKHEAYITRAALLTLAQPSTPKLATQGLFRYLMYRCAVTEELDAGTFALHIVKEDPPHDLLNTIVLTTRRPWWKLWMKHDHYEVIDYREKSEK